MAVGAELDPGGNDTHFRVWAPLSKIVHVVFEDEKSIALKREDQGHFSGLGAGIKAGSLYKLQMDAGEAYPDPASRFQPRGPHGFSQVVDPNRFEWTDAGWKGVKLPGQVIYEMHLGTFTHGGTWRSATEKLKYLRDTGITLIEVMPVADFPGRYGWGYDGVQPFAPASIYGNPEDMRRFVDEAHSLSLGVILDVVYNHVGPDGNYLSKFSPYYFSEKHKTDWGPAINYDGENCKPVREYFLENVAYWIRECHLDGLRLDATQDIHDDSQPNIIAEMSRVARGAAGDKPILLVGENEPQNSNLLRPLKEGGCGLDALWNDDYHHMAMVALTGKAEAYYTDYRGTPQEFLSAAKYGYLYQGQRYRWQKKRRGTPTLGLPRSAMINFLQNHDQVANSARGQRIHELTSPGTLKAVTAFTLLAPGTPMIFQGQEFAASSRFLFFADHKEELSRQIRQGRLEFLEQWRSLGLQEMKKCFDDPSAPSTFEHSRLDFSELKRHSEAYELHRDLLRIRRQDPVIARQGEDGLDGAVLSNSCFLLRFFSADFQHDRLLLVNLGTDLDFDPAPEPLLAPPQSKEWTKLWSSEDPEYGGCGTAPLDKDQNWRIPGQAAVLLRPASVQI